MDIDSNFDDDYNSINALKSKNNKKKKEPVIKLKKKVTFECPDDENSSNEETFDYEHEDVSDEESLDENLEDENESTEEILDEDENMSDEENGVKDHEEEFDYDHEEEFDYDNQEEFNYDHEEFDYDHENEKSLEKNCLDSKPDEDSLDNNYNANKKTKSLKEDIYGRVRKPDGTIVVSFYLFYN